MSDSLRWKVADSGLNSGRDIRLASNRSKDAFLSAVKTAIKEIGPWPRGVAAWVDIHRGNEKLADQNEQRVQKAIHLLEEVVASFPDDVTYRLVSRSGEKTYRTVADLLSDLERVGIRPARYSSSNGIPTIWNQPVFSSRDYVDGPFYDGPGVVRYDAKYLVTTPTGLLHV
jgi:hypothetical protein